MTPVEAAAFAEVIAKELLRQGLSFVLVVEADQVEGGEPGPAVGGGWHAGGNPAAFANMIRTVLAGITHVAPHSNCAVCNQALDDLRAALGMLSPSTAPRTCH